MSKIRLFCLILKSVQFKKRDNWNFYTDKCLGCFDQQNNKNPSLIFPGWLLIRHLLAQFWSELRKCLEIMQWEATLYHLKGQAAYLLQCSAFSCSGAPTTHLTNAFAHRCIIPLSFCLAWGAGVMLLSTSDCMKFKFLFSPRIE